MGYLEHFSSSTTLCLKIAQITPISTEEQSKQVGPSVAKCHYQTKFCSVHVKTATPVTLFDLHQHKTGTSSTSVIPKMVTFQAKHFQRKLTV